MKKNNQKGNKKITEKTHFWFKYWPLLILIFSAILNIVLSLKKVNIDCLQSLMVTDIIIILMPLIFTIITLSLSLSSETIYGQHFSQIRKIRKDNHFEFKEMIGLNILIFTLLTIFEVFNLVILVWSLDLISVIYCILFCYQEVPILAKSNSIVKKIIKNSGYLDEMSKYTDYFDGATSDGKIAFDIIQAILLSDGIVSTYNSFKTKDEAKNIILLDNLLSLQNNYLAKCMENKKYLSSSSISAYKGIGILQATEMAFSNLDSCILSNKDFNYINIVKSTKSYYQITRSIFSLHSLMSEINLDAKFNKSLNNLLHSCFIKINWGKPTVDEKQFIYRFFNAMTVYTISNNETWFIKSLRDAGFESKFLSYGLDYFYFITMYIFFICKVNKLVNQETKNNLNAFISEDCNGLNSEVGDNIKSIFNHNWHYKSFKVIAELLPNLLNIFDSCEEHYIWYVPPKMRSWSSSDGVFDKEFIIKNWLVLLLMSSSFWHFDYQIIENVFEGLKSEDRKILISVLNNSFIKDGKFFIKEEDTEYAKFYDVHTYLNEREFDQDFFKKIVSYILKFNKEDIMNSLNGSLKTEDDYKSYKKMLVDGLNNEAKNSIIYDSTLDIDLSKNYCYRILFMTEGSEQQVEGFAKDYKNVIDRFIYDEVRNNKTLMREIKSDNADKMADLIINNKYENCNNGIYIFYDYKIDENKLKLLNDIKHSALWLPNYCFWKAGALKFNLVCNDKETIVRPLTRDEINRKIDEEYSQVDGLYKYSKYQNDNRSIFISREELTDILSKQYFYACIVFNYKIKIDKDLIISLYKKKEKE